jgi:hypothetical protein
MNHKLANGQNILKGYENTSTLLFSLKELESRGHVNTIVPNEHFNNFTFYKFEPANKQYINQSIQSLPYWSSG